MTSKMVGIVTRADAFRRPGPRRVQNMGWTGDNELWVSTRGGDVLVSPTPGVSEKFDNVKVPSRGFGILDVGCDLQPVDRA